MAEEQTRWAGTDRQILRNGTIETVPYRQAVSLISRGLATWHIPAPVKTKQAKHKAPSKPQAPISEPPSVSTVSSPAKSVEAAEQGYEPAPSDP